MMKISLISIKKIEQRRVRSVTYVERLCKILKDLDILSKEQRNEILEVLEREDAAIAEVKEEAAV